MMKWSRTELGVRLDEDTVKYVMKHHSSSSSDGTVSKKEVEKKMTQLDVLMALKPDSAMDYDLGNGELRFEDKPVFLRETGEMEYPYGDTTFVAALVTAKCLEYSFKEEMRGARVIELGAGTKNSLFYSLTLYKMHQCQVRVPWVWSARLWERRTLS